MDKFHFCTDRPTTKAKTGDCWEYVYRQVRADHVQRHGPHHHVALAKAIGEWDVQSSMWMAPNTPATTSTGTATFTPVLDGKWLRQDFKGEMMNKPYAGIGLSGYDTIANKYISTWCDNFSTGLQPMTGTSNDDGKTITYTYEMAMCPMTGGPVSMRYVLVTNSPDKMTFTMYNTPKGQSEHKGMELIYTRTKSAK